MKIICAGYWKTGTKSLAEALRILGYKVYDYDDQFFDLGQLWDKFYDGTVTNEEIYATLKDIDVLIDGPVIAFWEEIHKVFPDAKVILTTRDEDSWYKSHQTMHDNVNLTLLFKFALAMLLPAGYKFNRRIKALVRFCDGIEAPFSLRPSDNPRLYKLKFRKHNSYVLHRTPKQKLLVHESKNGWSALCKFLGHEIPDQEYPHKNKSGSLPVFAENVNWQLKKLMKHTEYLMYCVIIIVATVMYYAVNCVLF